MTVLDTLEILDDDLGEVIEEMKEVTHKPKDTKGSPVTEAVTSSLSVSIAVACSRMIPANITRWHYCWMFSNDCS